MIKKRFIKIEQEKRDTTHENLKVELTTMLS
jgi:hypothetical protein